MKCPYCFEDKLVNQGTAYLDSSKDKWVKFNYCIGCHRQMDVVYDVKGQYSKLLYIKEVR